MMPFGRLVYYHLPISRQTPVEPHKVLKPTHRNFGMDKTKNKNTSYASLISMISPNKLNYFFYKLTTSITLSNHQRKYNNRSYREKGSGHIVEMSKADNILLDFWASPFCARVKIALEEKGVPYENREEDLFGGKSELLLKSNPIHQKVPVFLHNGKPVLESTIIVTYIDEVWPSNPLLPTSPYARAQALFWTGFIDKKVFEIGKGIWQTKGEEQEVAKRDFIEILKQLEEALGEKHFFGGDAFGYVDVIAIPLTTWFLAYEKLGGFKVEDHGPKITAWIKRCLQRTTVAKVLADPEKIYQFVLQFRKMQGIDSE